MTLPLSLFWAVALFGVASAIETRLSVFAFLLLVIALAALTRLSHPSKQKLRWALGVSLLFTSIGLCRFILGEAMPGIIEAHGRASSQRAVSFLREILFAQDAMRRLAPLDVDGDRIGSAGLLGDLTTRASSRATSSLPSPPLAPRYAPRVGTRSGPAVLESGYLFLVCLPRAGGGWTASPSEPIDEEAAERLWIAYAWPSDAHLPHETAYFIDEHENILETLNRAGAGLRLVGSPASPSCDDALSAAHRKEYKPWRGKKPRSGLPGDRTTAARP